jgi:hypothetical protein
MQRSRSFRVTRPFASLDRFWILEDCSQNPAFVSAGAKKCLSALHQFLNYLGYEKLLVDRDEKIITKNRLFQELNKLLDKLACRDVFNTLFTTIIDTLVYLNTKGV